MVMRSRKSPDALSILDLVRLYERGSGYDDVAASEFARRGDAARDELIRILDSTPAAKLSSNETAAVVEILEYKFPSHEASDAVERARSHLTDPATQSEFRHAATALRVRMSGHDNENWWSEHRSLEPVEQTLHNTELLADHAAPADRVFFLADAVNYALRASRETQRGESHRQALETKAEAYAREILSIPNVADKCGDGVYEANHALGVLALKRGDIQAAKRHLMGTANVPSHVNPDLFPCFPPDRELVEGLLGRGERDVVLEYLDCFKGCEERSLVEPWKQSIRSGQIPNFGRDRTLASLTPKERAELEREIERMDRKKNAPGKRSGN